MDRGTPPLETTVAFLFTDIEASTRLWEHYPEAMRDDLARHDALLHATIEAHGGHVFKTIGDAFCAAFPTPQAAVRAAREAQQALLRELPQLRVRMAVHTGEAVARDGDYFGPALNRVARLLIAGHGGQVLLSQSTVAGLGDSLPQDTHLQSMGEHRLRDLASKERIYQLQLPGLPDRFPPLNTLDVAFRRGLLRATAIAAVVIAVVAGLAIRANLLARAEARQRRLAQEGQRTLRRNLYQAQMKLAQQALESANIPLAINLLANQRPQPGQEELRGFEWRYLWRRAHQDDARSVWDAQQGVIFNLVYSPDGRFLATCGWGNSVKLWEVATGQQLAGLQQPGGGNSPLAFSPDSHLLAGADHRQVKLWDVGTRRQIALMAGHKADINSVAFSPDGYLLASSSFDGTVRLWSVEGRRALATLHGPKQGFYGVAFSPDSKRLATSDGTHTVRLWNVASRQEVVRLEEEGEVGPVAFTPDGRTLLMGDGRTGVVKWWDRVQRRTTATLLAHHGNGLNLSLSRDGKLLATTSWDGTVRLWSMATRQPIATLFGHQKAVNCIAFAPDGKTVASGSWDMTVRSWDTGRKPEDQLRGRQITVFRGALSRDGRTLVTGDWERTATTVVWDLSGKRETAILKGHRALVDSTAISPDGRLVATGSFDNTVRVWDTARGKEIARFELYDSALSCPVAFSPDGTLLAWRSHRSGVRVWDTRRRREVATLTGHTGHIAGLQFSPDGRWLASGSGPPEAAVKLWDVATWREAATLRGQVGWAAPLRFSPNGRQLAVGSGDFTVRIWDMATRRLRATLEGHTGQIYGIAFSPDGRTLVTSGGDSGDHTMRFWSTASWQEAMLFTDPQLVSVIGFTPDGRTLVWGRSDGVIPLWRAATLADAEPQIQRLRHQTAAAQAENARDWPAAILHLDALIAADPASEDLRLRRGNAHAELGQWSPAVADFAAAVKRQPGDIDAWTSLEASQLAGGNSAAYRKTCAAMLQHFLQKTPDLDAVNDVAAWCTVGPDAVVDPQAPVRLAARTVASQPKSHPYLNTLGETLYRAGRYQDAMQRLRDGVAFDRNGAFIEDWFFLSMASWQLHRPGEARRYLGQGIHAVEREQSRALAASQPIPWKRRFYLQFLRREAEALITSPQSPP